MYNTKIRIESTSTDFTPVTLEADLTRHLVVSRYDDGSESTNWPHYNDHFYREIAKSLDFDESDLLWYCYEHEFFHHFVPGSFFGRNSYVVWNSAHAIANRSEAAMMEERMVYYFQRYFHTKIQAPDNLWASIRDEAWELLL